jgi:membrane associated rhomboid family serine protease
MSPTTLSPRNDRDTFGTVAFYASLGRAFVVMCAIAPALFAIELIDQATGHDLDRHAAIIPRRPSGLDGIVFAPFVHLSWAHIYGNSIPLLLTGTFVLATGARRFIGVTVLVALTSGLAVWLFGDGPTLGASGVIFGYLGFLFMRGLVEHSWWTLGVAVLTGLLFGIALSGVVPGDPLISWQGHLGGFLGGLIAAVVFRQRRRRPTKPADELPSTITIPTVG